MRRSIFILTALIAMAATIQSFAQCIDNTECKGDRICQDGECVEMESQPTEEYVPTPAPPKPEKVKKSFPQFGVKGRIGLLLSNARGKGFEEYEDQITTLTLATTAQVDDKIMAGFTFGAGFSARFIKLLSAEIELLFAFKNFKVEWSTTYPTGSEKAEGKYKFAYMEFPMFAKIWIPINSKFHPNPYAGILVGFNLSAKLDGEYTNINGVTLSDDLDLKDKGDTDGEVSPVEFAFILGCEAMLELGPGGIIADIRWVPGVTSVFSDYKYDADDPIFSDQISLGSVCITFGYLFTF